MVQVALLNLDPTIPEAQSTPFDLSVTSKTPFFAQTSFVTWNKNVLTNLK